MPVGKYHFSASTTANKKTPMTSLLIFVCILLATFSMVLWKRQRGLQRERYIRSFVFPHGLFDKLQKKHPQLTFKECQLVSHALRQYFLTHLKSGKKYVSMPSQVVDDLWHEFILHTREYQIFCQSGFGQFFHHTPAAALTAAKGQSNAGLRRCWVYACREENINPANAARLPLLFAIDTKLQIANGFHYVADCSSIKRENDGDANAVIYCGGDFSSSSIDGDTSGFNDGATDSGSADSGAGDGCGGGGCGGGD